jgi:hypothetical protein
VGSGLSLEVGGVVVRLRHGSVGGHAGATEGRALSAEDLGREVDALHALPLAEFIPARDALVKRLRGEGRRDEAAEVGRLRRPTVPAWGVNRAVREAPEETEALLAAGEALRTAQAALLEGGSAGDLRGAQAAARAAEAAMLARVRAILDEAQRGGQGALERVRETLHAAVVDEAAASRLREGRLATELTAAGLGGGFGVADDDLPAERPPRRSRAAPEPEPEPAPEAPRRSASRAPDRPSAAEERRRRKAEAAIEALEAARRDVAEAEGACEAAAAAVAEAEAERTRAEEARAVADRAVAEAGKEVKVRAAHARAEERALSAARTALARAERAAQRAEADLEADRSSG